ncbi:MAG TPA: hypothetical protein VGG03_00610 [Thermoanaerobaculia bacterium]
MKEIVELVSQGMGMPLTPELESALHKRYFDWIIEKKEGVPTTPQEIWEEDAGAKIKARIEEIGRRLAEEKQQKPLLGEDDCHEVCGLVEADSDCPHCP